ncbi:hypothetical protein [Xanthobacter variabilis]
MPNALDLACIRILDRKANEQPLTLPDPYAALLRDEVASLPALRPQRRHA